MSIIVVIHNENNDILHVSVQRIKVNSRRLLLRRVLHIELSWIIGYHRGKEITMIPYYQSENVTLYNADCLELMPTFAAGSIDAVITDPPYYKINGAGWDNQWKTLPEYIAWLEERIITWRRILKDNGSIYCFGDDKVTAYIQVMMDKYYLLLNNIVWYKTNALPQKAVLGLRSYAPMTERILFYSCQYDPTGLETVKLDINNFTSLRNYFFQYQEALGLNIKQINSILGHRKAEHAFYWGTTQWDLPTPETYAELGKLPLKYEFVRREYEDLRREYEDLRREYEDLRRVFNADKNTMDVIGGSIINDLLMCPQIQGLPS
jgi:adenine-specific DNA-methyltransferase